jgi:hypothetical protein
LAVDASLDGEGVGAVGAGGVPSSVFASGDRVVAVVGGDVLATVGEPGDLVTTALVIAGTAYLIGRQLGASAEAAFFVSVAERSVVVDESTADDL